METQNILPIAEPTVRRFLATLKPGNPHPTSADELRQSRENFVRFETLDSPRAPAVEIADHTLQLQEASTAIRIIRPPFVREALPPILFFHGGGWVHGDSTSHDRLMRELAVGAHAAVVYVDFKRSPEFRYPEALENSYAVASWIADHGVSLNLDSRKIAVCGDSAGGNLAAAIAILSVRRKKPALSLQLLFYPVADADFSRPSYVQFGEGFMLTRSQVQWSWDMYAPDLSRRAEPTASPLRASPEELRGAPPALIIVGEHDVLRDEGEAYARRLMEADVPVTCVRYLGMIHAFMNIGALAHTPSARAAIHQACDALREVFASTPPDL